MMEFMPGGSVGDLLSKFGGQLDESVIRSYTCGILRGLDYLHRQGIMHCDIKSKNVLVGCGGVVKLGDLGSAKRTEEKGEISVLRDTPLWMAPEVVNQVEQGPPSDIWSVGCTDVEMITGTDVEMATGMPPWGTGSNPLAANCRNCLPVFCLKVGIFWRSASVEIRNRGGLLHSCWNIFFSPRSTAVL